MRVDFAQTVAPEKGLALLGNLNSVQPLPED